MDKILEISSIVISLDHYEKNITIFILEELKRRLKDYNLEFCIRVKKEIPFEEIRELFNRGVSSFTIDDGSGMAIHCFRRLEKLRMKDDLNLRIIISEIPLPIATTVKIPQEALLHSDRKEVIFQRIISIIKRKYMLLEIYNKLPKIDCGECSFKSCLGLAYAIIDGKTTIDQCVLLKKVRKIRIEVYGKSIYLKDWVENLFRKTILSMISTLKGVEISGDEKLYIRVSK
ncbi:MAG: (Fe-S)-binding protein [Candidatus Njordarchaeum guaymaensis]